MIGAGIIPLLLALQAIFFPAAARAESGTTSSYLQCVPFARQQSGINIYGDAHTWWRQARFAYQRGNQPRIGAVMSLKSHGKMRLGHVAVVSAIIDERNILLNHANWSPINGRRGQIERNVAARDVSAQGDWSAVKIWYAPISSLGKTAFPVNGFIYPNHIPSEPKEAEGKYWAVSTAKPQPRPRQKPLFNRAMQAELAQYAQREQLADASNDRSQPADLIGELLDRERH
ncbi:MAG: CHAP domain-containing protein [Parasphingorhabdus sp.]|uniref:CHAP domain-containing protein n=1 Tax=Parasphingorhabdus sp. TaxID=2709688 RepID=UPI003297BF69